ncbi:MAG: tyrosine-type recombinase/integrase [Spirirestis rafaelensis WJT71-NPBG6]|nr:tyrosine-type recombinase/integrase [Spirirestis rafaelensis WJT71-NPBG6]
MGIADLGLTAGYFIFWISLNEPLFQSCAYHRTQDGRLTGETVRALIDNLCKKAGITKKMSPHRIRHSSITTALEHSNGNYQKVQTLSRHASLNTIKIYDDNRRASQQQQELSNLLGDLLGAVSYRNVTVTDGAQAF